jgi:hypothetical protein
MHARTVIAALLSLTAAGCAGGPTPGVRVDPERMQYVSRQIARQREVMERQGYAQVGEPRFGALQTGVYEEYEFALAPGHYEIRGFCDQNCGSLSLRVYDRLGQPVASAREADDSPVVNVRAHGEGTVRVRARMAGCRWESCALALAIFQAADPTP